MMRAVTLPLAAPLDGDFQKLDALLLKCWGEATDLANRAAYELERLNPPCAAGADLPPAPKVPDTPKPADWLGPKTRGGVLRGLYGLVAVSLRTDRGFWTSCAHAVATICRDVERKYNRERDGILRRGERRSARYRFPLPFPVHNRCWAAELQAGRPVVRVKLPGGEVALQLRGGPEFARQLADFRRIAAGQAQRSQLLITRQRASSGCHRHTQEDREPGGGQRVQYRVMVKMVVDLPEREAPGGRVLTLLRDPAALWVAEMDGRRAWLVNADHLRRGAAFEAAHKVRLQRLGEDRKAEGRRSRRRRRQHKDHLAKRAEKFASQKQSWVQETVAHLIRFCERQKVGAIFYANDASGNLPLPWLSTLDARLVQAADAARIRLFTKDGWTGKEWECLSDKLRTAKELLNGAKRLLAARARKKSHAAVSAPPATSPTSPAPSSATRSSGGSGRRRGTSRPAAGTC